MSNFHEHYSELLKKLPPSIKKNIWNRLISRVRNPLSEEQASCINPDIEILLISEIDKYTKKKNRQRITSSPIQSSEIPIQTSSEVVILKDNIQITNSEEEINARVKEATDTMHQKFIETTQETLNSIKQQKDAECKQIRLDMALKSRNLFEHTLKKYIRDGTIYNLIYLLEEEDGRTYPDIFRKN
ncbi:hypothetical protein Glove_16g38 [Diversispora epigaea]|uniref:Uncharacterized protein n=1 Tax=Diversispora epigaea TaxID=1348612 RepID=A0A397JNT5_9GLOM|nr:hypothetical protein Glove_16g38 [Diversispora epigaea]